MTKKRFVKLLMARGIGRNEATKIAKTGNGKPYTDIYAGLHWWLAARAMGRLAGAFMISTSSAAQAVTAFSAFGARLSEF